MRILGVIALISSANISYAKSVKSSGVFPFPMPKRSAQLNYPPLPGEISDKVQGIKRKNSNAKSESALSRDWALASIGFFEAFNPFALAAKSSAASEEACPPEMVVAIVDTGIDYTHPDLKNNIWVNKGESGPWNPPSEYVAAGLPCRDKSCNGIDDDGNGFIDDIVGWDFVHDIPLPYDTHGHGTHIGGIVSATASTGILPGCSRVALMPLKYYDNSGAGYNNLTNTVRAIQYAVKNGAQIINYSGGGADPATSERAAIEEAQRKGVLFVAASGNDGHNNDQAPYYPASYQVDNIIGVASLNKLNQLLPSSNFGKTVHVGAPGLMILSTLPEGRFGTMSGTSQATAFVTGAAALLASENGKNFEYRKIKQWIVDGTRPLKGNEKRNLLSGGQLSLPKSLQLQRESGLSSGRSQEIAIRPGKK